MPLSHKFVFPHTGTTDRLYGTYKWTLPMKAESLTLHPEARSTSPTFDLCGCTWRLGFTPNRKGKIACWLTCAGPMPRPHNELCIQLWLRHQDPTKDLVWDKEVKEWLCHMRHGAFQWAPHTSLTDSTFIINDHLHLGVHMSTIHLPTEDTQSTESSMRLFAPFRNSREFSDIVLTAQGTKVHAHRVVLASHSAFMKAMLQSEMQEGTATTVNLKDIEGPVLKALVSHMYGTLKTITSEQLMPLFLAADAHQVAALRCRCLRQLLAHIDEDTILDYLQIADMVSDNVLMNACLRLWTQPDFSAKVSETPEMVTLMQEKPLLAQQLMMASINSPNKRKYDEIS